MENLFVRILNSALLLFALLCLIVTVGVLIFAGLDFFHAVSANTRSEQISIPYQPSNVVSATGQSQVRALAFQTSNPNLLNAAEASCDATQAFVQFVSKNQLSLGDKRKCRDDLASAATVRYEDRAENYLAERASYVRAAAKDPQGHALFRIVAGEDVQSATDKYLGQIQTQFDDKFNAAAADDDVRKSRELEVSVVAKAEAFWLASAASVAFVAFLVIAFLLVAVRVERHVRKIADA